MYYNLYENYCIKKMYHKNVLKECIIPAARWATARPVYSAVSAPSPHIVCYNNRWNFQSNT